MARRKQTSLNKKRSKSSRSPKQVTPPSRRVAPPMVEQEENLTEDQKISKRIAELQEANRNLKLDIRDEQLKQVENEKQMERNDVLHKADMEYLRTKESLELATIERDIKEIEDEAKEREESEALREWRSAEIEKKRKEFEELEGKFQKIVEGNEKREVLIERLEGKLEIQRKGIEKLKEKVKSKEMEAKELINECRKEQLRNQNLRMKISENKIINKKIITGIKEENRKRQSEGTMESGAAKKIRIQGGGEDSVDDIIFI